MAALWGQMVTDNGHAPLSEAMAVMSVPTMTKTSFVHSEHHIGGWWWELFQDSMKAAGEEEKKIAIANRQQFTSECSCHYSNSRWLVV